MIRRREALHPKACSATQLVRSDSVPKWNDLNTVEKKATSLPVPNSCAKIRHPLQTILGMRSSNPGLDELLKLSSFRYQLLSLRFGCSIGHIVINVISFSPARIKIWDERGNLFNHCQLQSFKRCLVMTNSSYTISFARDNHLRQLKDCVVRRCKTSVGGKLIKLCVFQISLHDGPQVVQFFVTRLMRFHALVLQQVFPGHFACLR